MMSDRVQVPLFTNIYQQLSTANLDYGEYVKKVFRSQNVQVDSTVLAEATRTRQQLVEYLKKAPFDINRLESYVLEYLSSIYGFVYNMNQSSGVQQSQKEQVIQQEIETVNDGGNTAVLTKSSDEGAEISSSPEVFNVNQDVYSKLRHMTQYLWIDGNTRAHVRDSLWEVICVCLLFATALRQEAQQHVVNERRNYDLKSAFKLLLKASGIFEFIENLCADLDRCELMPLPLKLTMIGRSSAATILKLITIAEAQEIALYVSMDKLDEKPEMVAQIARSVVEKFESAVARIPAVPEAASWNAYATYKMHYYNSTVLVYIAISLNKQDENGIAVACMNKSANLLPPIDSSIKQIITIPEYKPLSECFQSQFTYLQSIIKRYSDKFTHENNVVYHQQIPDEIPSDKFPKGQSVGKSTEFSYPQPAASWTTESYNKFDFSYTAPPPQPQQQQQHDPLMEQIEVNSVTRAELPNTTDVDLTKQNTDKKSDNNNQQKKQRSKDEGFSLCQIL
jgi:hypothetical protein